MIQMVGLEGCRPEPLGSYLKAVGLLRAVATQADPNVTGHWDGDRFVLGSELARGDLQQFLLCRWVPTPVVSPWNKDGGIKATGLHGKAADIAASNDARLRGYQAALARAQSVLADTERLVEEAQHAGTRLDDRAQKRVLLQLLRNRLPDEAILWLDAVASIADDVRYSPLLATGGNDGRDDFSKRYMEGVLAGLALERQRPARGGPGPEERARRWLEAALFDAPASLQHAPVGMFFAGQADVPSSPIGDTSVANPWDLVLALEGTLAFASALARRAGTAQPTSTFPFMLAFGTVGNAAAATDEAGKGELWAPLWDRPAGWPEVQRLLTEGRLEWRYRQAQTPVDAVRAVVTLGVDRGVRAFSRHLIVQRRGRSHLAQAVGRIAVRERQQVTVLSDVDDWVAWLRRSGPPATLRQALGVLDRTLWDAAGRDDPGAYLRVLNAVAACDEVVGRTPSIRARVGPISSLDAARWWPVIDDGTPEVRLAAALAGARDTDGTSLRTLVWPQQRSGRGRLTWSERPVVAGFGRRGLPAVLTDVLVARSIPGDTPGTDRRNAHPADHRPGPGVRPAFPRWSLEAHLSDIAALVAAELDEDRLCQVLAALLVLEGWSRAARPERTAESSVIRDRLPSPGFALLAPFYFPLPLVLGADALELLAQPQWARMLRAGQLGRVLDEARLRWRMAGREPAPQHTAALAAGLDPHVIATALLVPLGPTAVRRLARWVTRGPDGEADATEGGGAGIAMHHDHNEEEVHDG